MLRRRVLGSTYDARVHYLQVTSDSYIDTGYTPNQNTILEVDFKLADVNQNSVAGINYLDTNQGSQIRCHVGGYANRFHGGFGNNNSWTNFQQWDTNRHYLGVYKNSFYVDDLCITMSYGSINFTGHTILIGGQEVREGVNIPVGCKIYKARIYEGTTLVHNYIPVKKGNVGYLYDTCTGELLGTSGTTNFTIGPATNFADSYCFQNWEGSGGISFQSVGISPQLRSISYVDPNVIFIPNNDIEVCLLHNTGSIYKTYPVHRYKAGQCYEVKDKFLSAYETHNIIADPDVCGGGTKLILGIRLQGNIGAKAGTTYTFSDQDFYSRTKLEDIPYDKDAWQVGNDQRGTVIWATNWECYKTVYDPHWSRHFGDYSLYI